MKKLSFIILVSILAFVVGCDKESSLPVRFSPAQSGARLKFLHMSPDAPSVLIYANDIKITAIAPATNGQENGLGFGALYPANLGYSIVPSGQSVKIDVRVPANSPVLPGTTAFTANLPIGEGKYYTLAAVDSLSKLSTVVIEDDLSVGDPSKAYFRIANFMNNSPAKIEVHNTTLTPSNVTNATTMKYAIGSLPFKNVAAFDTLTPGQVYRFILKNPVTDARLDSVTISNFPAARKFTLYVRGVLGQSGSTNTRRPLIFQYANL
ncbi:DUF4397 domain-containing protein [Phnomibacter ginsenosidimutans]|uniref:DUF4397 domain-containing protein n=1 Tax=Phnomibacter ginsenosidimutans TaxID=2676868 RepID=A0A6I6G683_9BACT|nr:DUF4397 domain-containing protein [Phnomibacter ginsenosidimutans]QGW27757.1 DUF4397 domain-containing protein [Phnomibacter ginsenosidimutans]